MTTNADTAEDNDRLRAGGLKVPTKLQDVLAISYLTLQNTS